MIIAFLSNSKSALGVAILVLASIAETSLLNAADPNLEKEEALSYFDALLSNWQGVEQCDVTIQYETFAIFPDGRIKEDSFRYRMICDFYNSRFLFVMSGDREEVNPKDDDVRHNSMTQAFFFDETIGEAWVRHLPTPARRLPNAGVGETLFQSRFPDIRLIGAFGLLHDFDRRESIDAVYEAEFHLGKPVSRIATDGGACVVAIDDGYQSGRLRRRYRFDLSTLVPTQITYAYGTDAKETVRRKENLKWTEADGVYVPSEIHGERLLSVRMNGQKVSMTEQYDAAFSWHAVNKPQSQTEITAQTLQDSKSLFELLDAKAPPTKKASQVE